MPIVIGCPVRRISQPEFGEISFEVMRNVFAIHNEIGRFFNERIYKKELAFRMPDVRLEVPVDLTFGSFRKRLFLDVLVGDGAVFEFKAVDTLSGQHRAQLLQYLMLSELAHGKLINIRPEDVEHEYVNALSGREERLAFAVDSRRWNDSVPGAEHLREFLTGLLHDVGTGLEISLYEDALIHTFGGIERVESDVPVVINGRQLGIQRLRLIAPDVAFKITAFDRRLDAFELHASRLLKHVELRALVWVNINRKQVRFTTLEP